MGIYNLSDGSYTIQEISIYDKFLSKINNEIDMLIRESFVDTACDIGLTMREELLSLPNKNLNDSEIRRKRIFCALATKSNNFNLQGIINSFKMIGLNASIIENLKDETLTISGETDQQTTVDTTSIKIYSQKILPSHLDVIFNLGDSITANQFTDLINLGDQEIPISQLQ